MFLLVLKLTATLLIALSALSLSTAKIWWVRVADFPRLQLAIFAIVWLVFALFNVFITNEASIDGFWIVAVVAVLAFQLWWIWPSSSLHKKEVLNAPEGDDSPTLSLLSANVLMDNRQPSRLIALVNEYKPDVLATLESDSWWQSELDILSDYPHRLAQPLDNKYGMHLYSRIPLEDTKIEFLVSDEIPSMNVKLTVADAKVRLHIVHPTPPAPTENLSSEDRDVELLLLADFLKDFDTPVIVSGDLNDVSWSKTTRLFRQVSGLLDPRIGRGMFNTFHADFWFFRWPLDHVFVSNHWRVKKITRLAHIGSDHFPVFVSLALHTPLNLDTHLDRSDADESLISATLETDTAQEASTSRQ